jgi:peptide/nickel transport system substrate-binding protein
VFVPAERKLSGILILLVLLAGCGSDEEVRNPALPREPVRGGTAVIGVISDVDSWNEYLAKQTSSLKVLRRIYLPLALETWNEENSALTLTPKIAESWSPSPDGMSVTFRLRKMNWSDGVPLTAEDVRFTWLAQVSGQVAWSGGDAKSAISDVRVQDEQTVVFELNRTYPEIMSDIILGGILPEHIFGKIPFGDWQTYDWSQTRVGSGPYLLSGYRPGEEIRLTRNPAFYRENLPYLDRIVYRIVPDIGNLILQLQAGTVDLVDGISPWQAESLMSSRSVNVREVHSLGYDYIGWNTTRPPLHDPEIRKALTLAVDRKGIVEELLYGYGRVSPGPVPRNYRIPVTGEAWPYDPEQAREILASKGFRLKNGILHRNGQPFALEMTTNAGNILRNMVMVKVQEQLRLIGIKVTLLPPMQMSTFVSKNMSGEFDAYVGGWAFDGKVELRALFASDSMPPDGFNVVRYRSKEFDAALESMERASEYAEIAGALQRIHDRIHVDQPYTFLFESSRLAASSTRLHNLSLNAPGDVLAYLEQAWIDP